VQVNYFTAESYKNIQADVSIFYILLTVHHVTILGKWPTWCTILFYIFIYNSVHVSSTSCSSSGETNFINTTSDRSHSMSVAEMCAGWKKTVNRGCIDTICLSWWWARLARNM